MYCVKCGAELAKGQRKCPLCQTLVYHPDILETDLPNSSKPAVHEEFNHHGILFILSFIFAMPCLLTFVCDISINGLITWSGYAAGGLAFAYLVIVLPIWFKNPNPVIFVSADFIGAALLLLYISVASRGGWFLPFALPVTGVFAAITLTAVTLLKYLKRGHLYVWGGAILAVGAAMVLLEALINRVFAVCSTFVWSFYPFVILMLLGIALIVIAMCPYLHDSLKKKFFI